MLDLALETSQRVSDAAVVLRGRLPLLSYIVINFNYGRYLSQCVSSIYAQCYPNIECIVVDNASSDETENVLSELTSSFPFLQIVRNQSNVGQSAACRVGFEHAKGAYIAFIDADDFLLPNSASTHIRAHLTLPFAYGFTSGDMSQMVNDRISLGTFFEPFGKTRSKATSSKSPKFTRRIGDLSTSLETDLLDDPRYEARISIVGTKCVHWPWAPSSGSVYKKEAVALFIDNDNLEGLVIQTDAYLKYGINSFMGSALIEKPLAVYRIHGNNNFTKAASLSGMRAYSKDHDQTSRAASFALQHVTRNVATFAHRTGGLQELWAGMRTLERKAHAASFNWLERALLIIVKWRFAVLSRPTL